jgi:hypothetical protein
MAPLNDQIDDDFANRLAAAAAAREDTRSRMHTAGLTSILSLFLLLLAFFILLNSLAQLEANRTRAVLGSLAATFNLSNPNGQSRTLGSFVGHLDAAADLEREVTGLLRTLVGFGSFELIRTGTLLSVSIDNEVLFTDDGAASDKFKELAQPAAEMLTLAADDVSRRNAPARSFAPLPNSVRRRGNWWWRWKTVTRGRRGSNFACWRSLLQRRKTHEPGLARRSSDLE